MIFPSGVPEKGKSTDGMLSGVPDEAKSTDGMLSGIPDGIKSGEAGHLLRSAQRRAADKDIKKYRHAEFSGVRYSKYFS